MNEKEKASEQNLPSEAATTDKSDRMAQRIIKIEKRNAIIAQKGELLAQKYGFDAIIHQENEKESEAVTAEEVTDTQDTPATPTVEAECISPVNTENEATPPPKNRNTLAKISLAFSSLAALLTILLVLAYAADTLLPTSPAAPGTNVSYIYVDSGTVKGESYDSYSDMIEDVMKSVVIVYGQSAEGSSTGTGVIISEDGYIITNCHVVEGCSSIQVMIKDSEQYTQARLVGYKMHDDIAVLKVDMNGLRPMTFATSKNCRVGERVFAIGCPNGVDYAWSVTQGIISSPRRQLKIYDTTTGTLEKKMLVMQTDVAVNPGNSGGPLINASGQMVGIITMKLTDSSGMGFALPSDEVLQMVTGIIKLGTGFGVDSTIATGRPLIGITGVGVEMGNYYRTTLTGIEKVSAVYAEKNPDSTFYAGANGVYITTINSWADAKNKLKEGDIITHLNGATVFNVSQVSEIINDLSGGDTVDLTVYRNGESLNFTITLGVEELK